MGRPFHTREIRNEDRPLSELYRLKATDYVKLNSAANLMEELKTTKLKKMMTRIITEDHAAQIATGKPGEIVAVKEMADNKAERLARSSEDWEGYLRAMVAAREQADLAKVEMEEIRMKFQEWVSADANARAERRF